MARRSPVGREQVRRAWNESAEAWEDFVEGGLDYYRLEVHGPALLAACGPVKGLQVLDVGCGQGHFSRRLASKGARVVGINVADKQIEIARKRFRRTIVESDFALAVAVDTLEKVQANELPFERTLRTSETENARKEQIQGRMSLNLATYQATIGSHPVDLTYMEYELLRFFVTNPARVWSREQLLSRVWGYDYFGGARTVDVHVRRLRAKLGEERSSWITTVRSVGYRFG